jgi:hypothetical protein
VHKPLSNRLTEGKKLIQMARNSKAITHLIPWDQSIYDRRHGLIHRRHRKPGGSA